MFLPGCSNSHKLCSLYLFMLVFLIFSACSGPQAGSEKKISQEQPGMTVEQLKKMPKMDAHVHLRGLLESEETVLLAKLKEHNMRWFTISTRGMNRQFLLDQINLAAKLHKQDPEWIEWATSFSLENWGAPEWESEAIALVEEGFVQGARAVKVWKEIGMVLKDPDGSYVMIDDPRFDPIFDYVESRNKTLVAHIG